jgi:hypothetical protein
VSRVDDSGVQLDVRALKGSDRGLSEQLVDRRWRERQDRSLRPVKCELMDRWRCVARFRAIPRVRLWHLGCEAAVPTGTEGGDSRLGGGDLPDTARTCRTDSSRRCEDPPKSDSTARFCCGGSRGNHCHQKRRRRARLTSRGRNGVASTGEGYRRRRESGFGRAIAACEAPWTPSGRSLKAHRDPPPRQSTHSATQLRSGEGIWRETLTAGAEHGRTTRICPSQTRSNATEDPHGRALLVAHSTQNLADAPGDLAGSDIGEAAPSPIDALDDRVTASGKKLGANGLWLSQQILFGRPVLKSGGTARNCR